jgi:hypothetical protein
MFEKLGRVAEGLAGSVATSRRGFLGRVGKSALGAAGAVGALGVAASAQSGNVACCKYSNSTVFYGKRQFRYYTVCLPAGSTCPPYNDGADALVNSTSKHDCNHC